jgi:hypothetical protein
MHMNTHNRNQVELKWPKMRKKQRRKTSWLHYMFGITEPFVPSITPRQEKDPDVSTVRLPDCQRGTIYLAP